MSELVFLRDLVIILIAAIVVVEVLRHLKVPTIAGFIVAGIFIGPDALGLVGERHEVEVLAELGVILLLFGIGLELSLARIRKLWKLIVLGGGIQVAITIGLVVGISIALKQQFNFGLLLGFIIAISSTAIVLRGLSTRGEIDTPSGRFVLSILIFQDLCVVPMVLVIPFLGGTKDIGQGLIEPLLIAGLVITGVLTAARVIVPRLLDRVAKTRQRDLFVLTIFLICLGTAWLVSLAGVSLALGAFLAGLVVSGSRYREQAISELVPLRDVLMSIFFVSIGMLLDIRNVIDHLAPILLLFGGIVGGKFLIVFVTALSMRRVRRVALLSATSLSQVGEFSFVLLMAAKGTGVFEPAFQSSLTIAIILTMLATPFGLALGPHLVRGLERVSPSKAHLFPQPDPSKETNLKDHVIIAGYGLSGQNLFQALHQSEIKNIIVDLNLENIYAVNKAGGTACFGDITSPEVLNHLNVTKSTMLIITINDPNATLLATQTARHLSPEIPIIVRVSYETEVVELMHAGATKVFASDAAVSKVLSHHVLETISEQSSAT
jgi:CPA2 family monovalent cation:H+ antiporter-2